MKYKVIELKTVANNIRHVRKSKNISMDQLVELTGISKVTISNLENYKVEPKLLTIAKIAQALDTSLEELLY